MEIIGGDSDLSLRGRFYAQILPQALHERFPLVQEVDTDLIRCHRFMLFLLAIGRRWHGAPLRLDVHFKENRPDSNVPSIPQAQVEGAGRDQCGKM